MCCLQCKDLTGEIGVRGGNVLKEEKGMWDKSGQQARANIRGSGALGGLQLRYTFAYGGVLLGGLGVRRVSSLVCSLRNLNSGAKVEDTILSLWGRTWLFRAGLGRVILCEEVERSRHGTGGHHGGANFRQCGPDLGRGSRARKEDMGGREDSARQGGEISLSWPLLLGSIPALPSCLLHFDQPLKLSLSRTRLSSTSTTPYFPVAWHTFFSFPFLSLSYFLFARRKERSQKEHYLWKAVVRNFQRGWLTAPNAKCQRGEWGWALKKTWGLWAGNSVSPVASGAKFKEALTLRCQPCICTTLRVKASLIFTLGDFLTLF